MAFHQGLKGENGEHGRPGVHVSLSLHVLIHKGSNFVTNITINCFLPTDSMVGFTHVYEH